VSEYYLTWIGSDSKRLSVENFNKAKKKEAQTVKSVKEAAKVAVHPSQWKEGKAQSEGKAEG
jgi:hypothetical protein